MKTFLDPLGEPPHGLGLRRRYPPIYALRREEHLGAQIVAAHALGIGHRINLSKHLDDLAALLGVFLGVNDDTAPRFLTRLNLRELLLKLDRIGNETTRIGLYQHQLEHVDLFVGDPGQVELLQVLGHVVHDFLDRHVHIVFYDSLVNVPNDALDYAKLLKQLPPRI